MCLECSCPMLEFVRRRSGQCGALKINTRPARICPPCAFSPYRHWRFWAHNEVYSACFPVRSLYVCMCVCVCIYLHIYIHNFFFKKILVCAHKVLKIFMKYVLQNYYYEAKKTNKNLRSDNIISFIKQYFVFLRPVEILLHERGHTKVPPCNVLKKCLFYFF